MLKKGPLKHLDEGICECRSPRVISKEREKKKKKKLKLACRCTWHLLSCCRIFTLPHSSKRSQMQISDF